MGIKTTDIEKSLENDDILESKTFELSESNTKSFDITKNINIKSSEFVKLWLDDVDIRSFGTSNIDNIKTIYSTKEDENIFSDNEYQIDFLMMENNIREKLKTIREYENINNNETIDIDDYTKRRIISAGVQISVPIEQEQDKDKLIKQNQQINKIECKEMEIQPIILTESKQLIAVQILEGIIPIHKIGNQVTEDYCKGNPSYEINQLNINQDNSKEIQEIIKKLNNSKQKLNQSIAEKKLQITQLRYELDNMVNSVNPSKSGNIELTKKELRKKNIELNDLIYRKQKIKANITTLKRYIKETEEISPVRSKGESRKEVKKDTLNEDTKKKIEMLAKMTLWLQENTNVSITRDTRQKRGENTIRHLSHLYINNRALFDTTARSIKSKYIKVRDSKRANLLSNTYSDIDKENIDILTNKTIGQNGEGEEVEFVISEESTVY
ncbi:uncharacterized protein CMU_006040 [Cryptosporidium muris RN66]|uniref:Uncharacterized protein n=1 Tax=Cryptosporidium muris (strain RN66) TaxID=441375 RepID=B6AHI6_CRYMR|nr:uncharacterized protein CMU_006040 [Cryptosporidium muris RN66]EEA07681.1 hypothetical protein, conserved [Cryptosporidium muris RN66]|eukprot:XP_002142030.1 hypothetical protein [Cryptosporidium muris RN66]